MASSLVAHRMLGLIATSRASNASDAVLTPVALRIL